MKSNKSPLASLEVSTVCLVILTTIAVTISLMYLKSIMVPFTLALFTYFMVSPCVNHFERLLKVSRKVAVLLTLGVGLVMVAILGLLISVSINNFLQGAELYNERLLSLTEELSLWMTKYDWTMDLSSLKDSLRSDNLFSFAKQLTGQFMGVLGNFFLIIIFLIFLLVGQTKSRKRPEFMAQIHSKVSKYIWTKFITSFTTGILVGGILMILDLDLAFMFGVLAFLLNFIPSVGSLVAIILPLPVALLQFGLSWKTGLVFAGPGLVQLVIGNGIEPKMMGESLGLHPVTILFFLLFWGVVWGVPGMFLAVPITAILKYTLEQFPASQPLARLLAGEGF